VQASGLSADLIGLEGILDFHASNVNVQVNKAADTDNNVATVPAKLDWDSLATTGMALQSLAIDRALDMHADGVGGPEPAGLRGGQRQLQLRHPHRRRRPERQWRVLAGREGPEGRQRC
jgi:hypothetical protein